MEFTIFVSLLLLFGCLMQQSLHSELSEKLPDGIRSRVSDTTSPVHCSIDFRQKSADCGYKHFLNVPDDLTNDIQILNLSRNIIQTLYNTSFTKYTLLTELDLSRNDIRFIETASFYPLVLLRKLDMFWNANLNIIHSDIFKWSVNLLSLDLNRCNLTSFPNDTFKWLQNLERMKLVGNPIGAINLTICPRKTLLSVDLRYSRLEMITNESFIFKCKCEELIISSIVFRVVDPEVIKSLLVRSLYIGWKPVITSHAFSMHMDLFKGIAGSTIEEVTLMNFNCSFYSTLNLLENKHLSLLVMQYNDLRPCITQTPLSLRHVDAFYIFASDVIPTIQPEYFNELKSLQELRLVFNQISNIDASAYPWKIDLQLLDLSLNTLSYLDASAFDGLTNLSYLDLSNNRRLVSIGNLTFLNLIGLNVSGTALNMCSGFKMPNLISFLFSERLSNEYIFADFFSIDPFKGTPLLERIDLSNSRFNENEFWDPLNKISKFAGLFNLKFLGLQVNNIRHLQSGMFYRLTSLYELDLSRCKIVSIEKDVFTGLEMLSILHLEDNIILGLPSGLFKSTYRLQFLYMDGNVISYLDGNLFASTSNLTNFTISRNELMMLNRSTFRLIKNTLKAIDLSENPFECSCELKWLVQWLRDSTYIIQMNKGTCYNVLDITERRNYITMIDLDELCISHIARYCAICFVAIVLLLLIPIIHHNRWLLRYKIFLIKLAVLGYRETQDARHHTDFRFDLNIMFTIEDEAWATAYLKPNLEEQLPQFQRIAFGDDDLPLGMYYLDAVLYVIEHSFKTILVLSRASTRDDEFMMKLRIALNHMTNTKLQSTLLIFLEDIPEEQMPHLVKLYLSEQRSYSYWVEEERGQRYFLKQLMKCLTVNVRRNDMIPPE